MTKSHQARTASPSTTSKNQTPTQMMETPTTPCRSPPVTSSPTLSTQTPTFPHTALHPRGKNPRPRRLHLHNPLHLHRLHRLHPLLRHTPWVLAPSTWSKSRTAKPTVAIFTGISPSKTTIKRSSARPSLIPSIPSATRWTMATPTPSQACCPTRSSSPVSTRTTTSSLPTEI